MTETLKLGATLKDGASKPLARIREALKGLDNSDLSKLRKQLNRMGGEAKTQGKAVDDLRKKLSALGAGFNPLTAGMQMGAGSLAAFGVTSLSLIGIMDALKSAITGAAEQGKALQNLSRVTGLDTGTLQSYQKAMDRYGISAGETSGFLNRLNDEHAKLSRGIGWGDYSGPLHAYGERLRAAKNVQEEARAAFDQLNSFGNDSFRRRMFARDKLGNEALAGLPKWGDFLKMYGAVSRTNMSRSDVDRAAEFDNQWKAFTDEITKVKNDIGVTVMPAIEGPLKDLGDYLHANEGNIRSGIEGFVGWAKDPATLQGLKDFGAQIEAAAGGIKDFTGGLQGLADFLNAINPKAGKPVNGGEDEALARNKAAADKQGFRPGWVYDGKGGWHAPGATADGVITGNPANAEALRSALQKKIGEIGQSFGDKAGDTLTKPGGPAEQFGKDAGKALLDSVKEYIASTSTAGLTPLDRISAIANGGLKIAGTPGAALGRRRGRGGGGAVDLGSFDGAGSGSERASPKQLMDFLVQKHGWTPAAAAVAAAQAFAESSFNPQAVRPNDAGPGKPSVGLFQWNRARLAGLQRFGGKAWLGVAAQEEYFAREAEKMLPGWKYVKDLSHANEIGKAYEGYKGPIQAARAANAARYLRDYSMKDLARHRGRPSAAAQPIKPDTPTGTVNVHITGDRKDKVSVNSDGMFKKVTVSRRFFSSQQEVT